jgi:hypothetical protein
MDTHSFLLRLKLNKLHDSGIFTVALLSELLNKQGGVTHLVQGYCMVAGDTCWHVWIEDDEGNVTDILRKIAISRDQNFEMCAFRLFTEPPAHDYDKNQSQLDLWDVYNDNPANFWKSAPKKFTDFRSKCHRLISKNS